MSLKNCLKQYRSFFTIVLLLSSAYYSYSQQFDPELTELRTTVEVASKKNVELEQQVALLKNRIDALSANLAITSDRLNKAKENSLKLQEIIDGFGLEGLTSNNDSLRQKLVSTLGDLKSKVAQSNQLNKVSDLKVGEQLVINDAIGSTTSEDGAPVVAVKNEFGVAICAFGAKSNIKCGMPIIIHRADKIIAKAIVAEVRSDCAGLILNHETSSNVVKCGDIASKAIEKN